MGKLLLHNIGKSYGGVEVLHAIDLEIARGELIVFVGPSGCGKSTLLRIIAGLEEITSGDLYIDDLRMNNTPSAQRGIAMVFQSYALYPHMTVRANMEFGIKIAGIDKARRRQLIAHAARILQLDRYLDRLPKSLSGGQRQRVAIGRAIVREPKVFLFDEPLSNLDAALRVATRIEINKLHQSLPDSTMIYVTHDQVEAMTLADRIVVINQGRIEQAGAPLTLYRHPANIFVAQFIGSPKMNLLQCRLIGAGNPSLVELADTRIALPVPTPAEDQGKDIYLGIRPEDLRITTGDQTILQSRVAFVENLGEHTLIYLHKATINDEPVISKSPGTRSYAPAQQIGCSADLDTIHLFDPQGQSYRSADYEEKS